MILLAIGIAHAGRVDSPSARSFITAIGRRWLNRTSMLLSAASDGPSYFAGLDRRTRRQSVYSLAQKRLLLTKPHTTYSLFSPIEADSMEAALSVAKVCPFLDIGGSFEVSELMQMPF